jgi:hypothetical protein
MKIVDPFIKHVAKKKGLGGGGEHPISLQNRIISKVTLSFTPYLLFQWYLQSKEILLNLWVWNAETQHLMHKVRE